MFTRLSLVQIDALSPSALSCSSPCFPSHKMASLMTHHAAILTETWVVLKLPFSPNYSYSAQCLVLWGFPPTYNTNRSLFPVPINMPPSSLNSQLLKPLDWLPYTHSCSARVHSHTTAKVSYLSKSHRTFLLNTSQWLPAPLHQNPRFPLGFIHPFMI